MSRKTKEIIRAAGLRDELTFTSFRHGGFTEAADADLSDAEMRAQGRHRSAKVLPRYAKRTMKQVAQGARKRRAARTKGENLSERAAPACQNGGNRMTQVLEKVGVGDRVPAPLKWSDLRYVSTSRRTAMASGKRSLRSYGRSKALGREVPPMLLARAPTR